ncbi:hypothetical protein [Echinicola sp. 20G]|uniref:hypothetical protein n=1 Tax=Echinicola sp. 20G TaxID=2781961 RepID=UPI001911034F|nr:hypothetical protein [Echinicola sp. 20G]
MIKFVIRFLLSLCILLSSGYSQLYAHHIQEGRIHAAEGAFGELDQSQVSAEMGHESFIIKTSLTDNAKDYGLDVLEIEEKDDEFIVSNKYLADSSYLTAIFYAFSSGYLIQSITNGLHISKHLFNTSSYRIHLVLQVFVI